MTDELIAKLAAARERIVRRVLETRDSDGQSHFSADEQRRYEMDARFHFDFLYAAVSLSTPRLFESYVGWLIPHLDAQGIGREYVARSLRRLSDASIDELGGALAAPIVAMIETALSAPRESTEARPLGAAGSFFAALVRADRGAALSEARSALAQGVDHLYEDVVMPAMHELGALWHRNQLVIGEEHLATALAQATIATLYPEFPWSDGGPTALVAAPPGERHEFGARMLADLLALDGWRPIFLGADTPIESLAEMAASPSVRLVAISVTVPFSLPAARRMALAVRSSAPSVGILAGGRALHALVDPMVSLAVDACAFTAREGRELARRWRQ